MTGRARVLIADDDEDIRTLVGIVLAKAGYEIESVDGGVAALAAGPAQLYVLDVRMPDLSGVEVCRRLKQRAPTGRVLMISAESSGESIAAAHAAGCDDYLPKPFHTRDLVRRVEDLLAGEDAAQRVA